MSIYVKDVKQKKYHTHGGAKKVIIKVNEWFNKSKREQYVIKVQLLNRNKQPLNLLKRIIIIIHMFI